MAGVEGNTGASATGKTPRSAGIPDRGMRTSGFPRNLGDLAVSADD
jgi:hypothetical protein